MNASSSRLDYLDATRAFALVLGIVFHASLSFAPVFMGWAVQDVSTSPLVGYFMTVSHSFRMELFFLLAGFFGCMTLQRRGVANFAWTRACRIVGPFVAGWFVLRPLVVSGWHMGSESLRGDYDFWAAIGSGFQTLKALPAGIFTGSHLWFLYYLALVTTIALAVRAGVNAMGAIGGRVSERAAGAAAWLVTSRWGVPLLAVPTAGALWFMRYWGMDTPDQSLRPHVPVLLVYAAFFGLGWLIGPRGEVMERAARLALERGLCAVAGIAGVIWLGGIQTNPSHEYYFAAHVGYVVAYALMMWALVFLTMGFFRKTCSVPRAWVRYVADSSYWMYLIHLPLVVWLQVAVAEWPLHWSLKLGGVVAATIAISLLTYDLFVRSTWLGRLLNGTRRERAMNFSMGRSLLGRRRERAVSLRV